MGKNRARATKSDAGSGGVTESGTTITPPRRVEGDQVLGDKVGGNKIRDQFNTEGGAVFLRAVEAQSIVGRDQITQHINYGSLPIAWPKESEQLYLKRIQEEFAAFLRARNVHEIRDKPRVELLLAREAVRSGLVHVQPNVSHIRMRGDRCRRLNTEIDEDRCGLAVNFQRVDVPIVGHLRPNELSCPRRQVL